MGLCFFSLLRLPVESILSPLFAEELLGVFSQAATLPVFAGIFALCIHIGQADLDRTQFIPADPSAQNLFLPCFGIEEPDIAFLDDGNRKGVVLFSHVKNDPFVTLAHHFTCLFVGLDKTFSNLSVSHLVAGKDNLFPVGPKMSRSPLVSLALMESIRAFTASSGDLKVFCFRSAAAPWE